jgi:hypothetical protein
MKTYYVQSSLNIVAHFSTNIFKKCNMNLKMNNLKMKNHTLRSAETGILSQNFVER